MKKVVMTDGERQRTAVPNDGNGGNQAGECKFSSLGYPATPKSVLIASIKTGKAPNMKLSRGYSLWFKTLSDDAGAQNLYSEAYSNIYN
jgi:hypothetical protein